MTTATTDNDDVLLPGCCHILRPKNYTPAHALRLFHNVVRAVVVVVVAAPLADGVDLDVMDVEATGANHLEDWKYSDVVAESVRASSAPQ
jgi:hypothetical protein